MYKELNKYRTGLKIDVTGTIVNIKGHPKKDIKLNEYKAQLGDLLHDYIKHINKPFWRRKYYHNHLTSLYRRWLNQITIVTGFDDPL